jgi:ferredoxin-thioredoxin reductase catalytic subunit
MKVIFNPDASVVSRVREGLKRTGGYCPCKIKSPDTKCMCKEFRDQIADPNFYGLCYCGLYLKVKDDTEPKNQ